MDNASLKGYFKQNVRFSLKAELNPYTTVRFVPGTDVVFFFGISITGEMNWCYELLVDIAMFSSCLMNQVTGVMTWISRSSLRA